MTEVYFDNAATTRTFPEVRDAMMEALQTEYGNPSSMHRKGFEAERQVTAAREKIASTIKVDPKEIYFTSGGTEGNNLALLGSALAHRRMRRHIISSRTEHASVLNTLRFLEREGFEITWLPVDSGGRVRPEDVRAAVRDDTMMVSLMAVNNEIGAISPVEEIGRTIKEIDPEILFHTDCVQAYGKIPVLPRRWKADLLTASGHKIHGPKGVGFLYIKEGTRIKPIVYGGNQARGMRSGTENVPGIAGFAAAAGILCGKQEESMDKVRRIKDHLCKNVSDRIDNIRDNSGEAPHIASISFPGVRSEVLLHALEDRGIYVSAGSACSSNKPEVSGTLKGIGLTREYYESTLRFSFSVYNTLEEADYCVEALEELVPMLRRFQRR